MTRRNFVAFGAALPTLASEQRSFALIGAGNRGRGVAAAFAQLGARCLALCDVYEPHLQLARERLGAGAKLFTNYREALDRKDIDFVVIATPDHHHCPMLLDSLAANKDVYLEKPLSMSLEESDRMVKAVRATNRIVQIGMQRRSMQFIHRARNLIADGALGRVSLVKALWNWHFDLPLDNSPLPGKLDWERFQGNAPKRPLEPRRFRWWRGFWDYSGGNMTDQGTHLMDVVQWMMNSGAPTSAVCQGRVHEITGAEVPNVFTAVFEYPDFLATWTLNYRSSYEHDWSITFQGEKATMFMDRRGLRIIADEGLSPEPWRQKPSHTVTLEIPDTDNPNAHMKNFLDCLDSRQEPNCPIEVAAAAVAGPHMANLAYKQRRRIG
jgi:predicted dehydrogenase